MVLFLHVYILLKENKDIIQFHLLHNYSFSYINKPCGKSQSSRLSERKLTFHCTKYPHYLICDILWEEQITFDTQLGYIYAQQNLINALKATEAHSSWHLLEACFS